MKCPSCNRVNIPPGKNCPHCGAELPERKESKLTSLLNTDLRRPKPAATSEVPTDTAQAVTPPRKAHPACPSCGSDSIKRFSRTWKVTKIASVGAFGLGNVHKIFKCKSCGYKW